MKKLMSVLLAACMLVGLVACSNPAENPPASSADSANVSQGESSGAESEELEGKLVFWTTWSETETQGVVFQEMCDAFTELHPKVEIELQFYGRELGNVLKPALDAGEQIDIFDYPPNAKISEYALDLTDFLQREFPTTDGKPLADTLMPALLTLPKKVIADSGDQMLAMGYQPWTASFFYNASIFEELSITPPTTWTELDAVCAAIKEAGYSPITFDDAYAFLIPGMFLEREKGEEFVAKLIADTTGEMWRDEAVVKMAEAIEDFAKKGYFDANVAGNKWPAGQIDIGSGKVAMYYNASWLPNELMSTTGEDFKWGAFHFPDTAEGANKAETTDAAGCSLIGINKNSENIELAMQFLAFMNAPENDQKLALESSGIPSTKTAEWPAILEGIKPSFEKMESTVLWGGGMDQNPDVTPIVQENFTKLAAGSITAEQFVEAMASATKR